MTIPSVTAESPPDPSDIDLPALPSESEPPDLPSPGSPQVDDEMILPSMVDDPVDADFVSPSVPTEAKSVLPPPTSTPPFPVEKSPSTPAESIAGSYKFPTEKEESSSDQSGDSSHESDEKDMEELKPPPF
jgi:hypothetical protein